jgi:hypothetical protein
LHPLLGAVHTDTEVITPPDEGSLVLANDTPVWDVLLHNDTAGCAMVSDATTWTMDQTPTWTGDHTWDDGSGNSPSAVFVGASDDEGKIYLRNSATPGDSDVVIRLCADDDDSRLEIRNLSGALMAYISALGNFWLQEDIYITTTDGIIHADGVAAGLVLRANGTKFVPGTVTMDDITGGDAEFVVMSLTADLANERRLQGGDSLTLTDGGAGGDATLDLDLPGTLTVSTANNAAAPHLHTITSSSNPGAAASILASAADGGLQLLRLGIGVDPNADNLIRMVDNSAIGLSNATGRIVFDETGVDAIEVTSADLQIATTAYGITHVDGVAAGQYLRANGTRYVPSTIQAGDVPALTAQFLTLALSGDLSAERVFVAGDSLTGTDGGANGNYTLDLDTPGTLTVSTANNAAAPHLHTITSSSNPGVAASLLATDANGDLSIQDLTIADYLIHSGDTDTFIRLQTDQMQFVAGNVIMMEIIEAATDYINVNVSAYFSEYLYHLGDADTSLRFQADQITLRAGGTDIIDIVEAATDYVAVSSEIRVGSGPVVEIRATGDLTTEADIWLDGDGGISAEGSLYVLIDSDNNSSSEVFEVAKDADTREIGVSGTQVWTVFEDSTVMQRDSSVEHGATSIFKETDVFFQTEIAEAGAGGVAILGGKDSGGVDGAAVQILGLLDEDADDTKTTAGRAIIEVYGGSESGGGWGNVAADGNVWCVRARRGGAWETVAIIDEDGDFYYDGGLNNYDAEDDALAVLDLQRGLTGRWEQILAYNQDRFQNLGILGQGDTGTPLVSTKGITSLLMGAVGQLYEKCQKYELALSTAGLLEA